MLGAEDVRMGLGGDTIEEACSQRKMLASPWQRQDAAGVARWRGGLALLLARVRRL
jgi:hypothetical protein